MRKGKKTRIRARVSTTCSAYARANVLLNYYRCPVEILYESNEDPLFIFPQIITFRETAETENRLCHNVCDPSRVSGTRTPPCFPPRIEPLITVRVAQIHSRSRALFVYESMFQTSFRNDAHDVGRPSPPPPSSA